MTKNRRTKGTPPTARAVQSVESAARAQAQPEPKTVPLPAETAHALALHAAQERAARAELALIQEQRARVVDRLVVALDEQGLDLEAIDIAAGTATVRPQST